MRTVTLIVVHCSANQAGSAFRMADIDRYHRSLGWIGCGYHYVIPTDGTVEPGRPEEMTGAHCKGHNRHSIGVCYIGGLSPKVEPTNTRPEAQRVACFVCSKSFISDIPKPLLWGIGIWIRAKAVLASMWSANIGT